MKRNILSYTAPEIDIFEVVAERGYNQSAMLPSFGVEQDDFIY
jgi:hypothetical protein